MDALSAVQRWIYGVAFFPYDQIVGDACTRFGKPTEHRPNSFIGWKVAVVVELMQPEYFEESSYDVLFGIRPSSPFGIRQFSKQDLREIKAQVIVLGEFEKSGKKVFEVSFGSPCRHGFECVAVHIADSQIMKWDGRQSLGVGFSDTVVTAREVIAEPIRLEHAIQFTKDILHFECGHLEPANAGRNRAATKDLPFQNARLRRSGSRLCSVVRSATTALRQQPTGTVCVLRIRITECADHHRFFFGYS